MRVQRLRPGESSGPAVRRGHEAGPPETQALPHSSARRAKLDEPCAAERAPTTPDLLCVQLGVRPETPVSGG